MRLEIPSILFVYYNKLHAKIGSETKNEMALRVLLKLVMHKCRQINNI